MTKDEPQDEPKSKGDTPDLSEEEDALLDKVWNRLQQEDDEK